MSLFYEKESPAKLIFRAVEREAARHPDEVALADDRRSVTWRDLNERSASLAARLSALGTSPDSPVALCMPGSPAMIVAALGIMRAGGAYVPLDPALPEERLAGIVRDAGAKVLVTDNRAATWAVECVERIVMLDDGGPSAACAPGASADALVTPDNLAYIIYTSGSTGQPKGVEVTHRSLANLVSWHQRAFGVSRADRATQLAGVGFDAAVWEVWPYLAAGAPIHFAPSAVRADPAALRDWLVAEEITITFVPTVMAERLIELAWPADVPLRVMLTGGDALHSYPPPGLPFELVNNYGPTECTVVATSGAVRPGGHGAEPPDIGCAITNVRAHVVDGRLQEVADGIPGELCIGGVSVARGYRNRPDLTAERFVPDPFYPEPGARLFRTGDIVRRLPGGELAFVGRLDDQVKLRGYRIEPGEITFTLKRHRGVRDGVVVAAGDGADEKRLVAYWVPVAGDLTPSADDLVAFLRRSLPDYMVPSAFVRLDALPLTPNGKVDRAALLESVACDVVPSDDFV
ncbi:MAG TPA: amino acid adenylation domain-containing protein, partial [Gemmatimonadaceae bacterium]|nr:amino acid adenylation domain-containing protein [Gemmatimonadaceae bacterium]